MTQVDKEVYNPLIIAAGGGGRGYSSLSETQLEQMDYDPNQPGRNGKSNAAGTLRTALVCVQLIVCRLYACVGKYNIFIIYSSAVRELDTGRETLCSVYERLK